MARVEEKRLPDKCCAFCGFLYGLATSSATLADAMFDPDLIRSKDYPPPATRRKEYWADAITSRVHMAEKLRKDATGQQVIADLPGVQPYTWADTDFICCYMNEFDPISIRSGKSPATEPFEWLTIEPAIRKNRQDCASFFRYHPGYTAAQHVELQLEQQRARRAEDHEKALAKWSSEQEERLTRWANSQEDWRRALERRWMVVFGILGLIYTALGWLVGFLIAGK